MCAGREVLVAALGIGLFASLSASGQQVTVTTPQIGVRDSFYESFGTNFGFQWHSPSSNVFFNRGAAIPPFAPGFGSAGTAGFGFGVRGGGGGFSLGFQGASGSHRSLSMTAPSVTMMNGGVGVVQDLTVRPFVTGLIPLVGDYPVTNMSMPVYATSPLTERLSRLQSGEQPAAAAAGPPGVEPERGSSLNRDMDAVRAAGRSTAETGDLSVAEIRRQRDDQREAAEADVSRLIAEAQAAEIAGRWGAARIRYRQAAAQAEGDLKQDLLRRMNTVGKDAEPRNDGLRRPYDRPPGPRR